MKKPNPLKIAVQPDSKAGHLTITISLRLTTAEARHIAEVLQHEATAAEDAPQRGHHTPRKKETHARP